MDYNFSSGFIIGIIIGIVVLNFTFTQPNPQFSCSGNTVQTSSYESYNYDYDNDYYKDYSDLELHERVIH